jgi:flagellar hook-associated protein 2
MAAVTNTYDPTSTAQSLATAFTSGRQSILTRQTTAAATTVKALTTLGSALTTFQTTLASLSGVNKTMSANSAVFSDTGVGSATASASAAAGSYAFFVAKVASAQKVSFSGLKDFAAGGTLTFGVGAASFNVPLTGTAPWTVRDLAAAINGASNNTTLSASVVTTTTNGVATSELVLSSKQTGELNTISVTTTGTSLDGLLDLADQHELSPAQDAEVYIGAQGGTLIKQASNTLNVIDGVTMTLSQAQAPGSAPVTLTVGTDTAKTTANLQAFVDAYNKMKAAVDGLVAAGDPASGSSAGAFANDSGVRSLRDRMVSLLRGAGTNSLASFGILATREGTLSLDTTRLAKALATNPTGLDTLIGSASSATPTGVAGQLQTYLKVWTNSANGQIGSRKDAIGKLQMSLTDRQSALDRQYDSAYARYLEQFTKLQTIQSSMSYNTSLFDAMFSNSKD